MNRVFSDGVAGLALALSCVAGACAADAFPSKPVRIVVPTAPGGALDLATRVVAQKMGEKLGQSVIVDNRPGADSMLGTRVVKDAPADGYTLLAHTSTLTALPALKVNPGFELKDFVGVAPVLRAPQIMVVSGDLPIRNLADFAAASKASKLSYASGGTGSTLHLGAAMYLLQEKLDLLHVPYKGAGAALPDVAAGRVSMMFGGYSGVASYLQSGKLRPLGVTATKRLAAAPEVPTFVEQGVNYSYYFWVGYLAPAGTPKAVVARLAEAIQFAVQSKEVQERFRADGSEPWSATPEEFTKYIAVEAVDTAKLVGALKIPKD